MATEPQEQRQFNPLDKMGVIRTQRGQQSYLAVKDRILWLRAEHPDANVVTEQIEASETHARFKCTISYAEGIARGSDGPAFTVVATGHGSETKADFPDFYEKAETKAIGRACAALGYGTDAAKDFDDGEPLDGLGAAQHERAARRQEIDQQHQRNTQGQGNALSSPGRAPAPQQATQRPPAAQRPPAETSASLKETPAPARQPAARKEGQATGRQGMREAAKMLVDTNQEPSMTIHAKPPATLTVVPQESPEYQSALANEGVQAQAHMRSIAQEGTGRPPAPVPARPVDASTLSNVHQHAQLQTLTEAGVGVAGWCNEQYGLTEFTELTREQAKQAIIWGRAEIQRLRQEAQ